MTAFVDVQLTVLALHALLVQTVDHRTAMVTVSRPHEMMCFELVQCGLLRLLGERRFRVLAFRFHLLVTALVNHSIARQTTVALQTDTVDELVTMRTEARLLQ